METLELAFEIHADLLQGKLGGGGGGGDSDNTTRRRGVENGDANMCSI